MKSTLIQQEAASTQFQQDVLDVLTPCLSVRLYPQEDLSALARGDALRQWLWEQGIEATICPIFPDISPSFVHSAHRPEREHWVGRLLRWHRIFVRDIESLIELYLRIKSEPSPVERTCFVPRTQPTPTDEAAGKKPFYQEFREAIRGIGIDQITGTPGSDGRGIWVADIEQGWRFAGRQLDHPELKHLNCRFLGYPPEPSEESHGLRVLGVLLARHQQPPKDVAGIVPAVKNLILLGNRCRSSYNGADFQATDEMLGRAFYELPPGSIILVEAQTIAITTTSVGPLVPAEYEDPVYDAICACVSNGLTVVAAAGNGYADLDNVYSQQGETLLSRSRYDSGAIVVGASNRDRTARLRAGSSGSNYGSRIDCFAAGAGITSVAYNNHHVDPYRVDDTLTCTSAATAIIAGVAISLQGMCLAQRGRLLRPDALRGLLTHPNLAAADLPSEQIGRMPALDKLAPIVSWLPDSAFL